SATSDAPTTCPTLATSATQLDAERDTADSVLYSLAVPRPLFASIGAQVAQAGGAQGQRGWRRLIVEKPFGRDLSSAIELSRDLLAHWREEQIYRIDHYLGKETVQNLLAFRFSHGMFEPLWNTTHIAHNQTTVT